MISIDRTRYHAGWCKDASIDNYRDFITHQIPCYGRTVDGGVCTSVARALAMTRGLGALQEYWVERPLCLRHADGDRTTIGGANSPTARFLMTPLEGEAWRCRKAYDRGLVAAGSGSVWGERLADKAAWRLVALTDRLERRASWCPVDGDYAWYLARWWADLLTRVGARHGRLAIVPGRLSAEPS